MNAAVGRLKWSRPTLGNAVREAFERELPSTSRATSPFSGSPLSVISFTLSLVLSWSKFLSLYVDGVNRLRLVAYAVGHRVLASLMRKGGLFRRPIAEGGAETVSRDAFSLHASELHGHRHIRE